MTKKLPPPPGRPGGFEKPRIRRQAALPPTPQEPLSGAFISGSNAGPIKWTPVGSTPQPPATGPAQPPIPPYTQKPRIARACQNFWLDMAVPFTGTANESVIAYTSSVDFDVLIRGGWSSLSFARARFTNTATGMNWSPSQVPIRAMIGNSDKNFPMRYYRSPAYLFGQAPLQGSFLNTGPEAAGTVVFLSEKWGTEIEVPVKRSSQFWLLIDLSATGRTTEVVDYPLLIHGATTNCDDTISARIIDETLGYAWSGQPVPVRSMAGVDSLTETIMWYPKPYYLPARVRLRAEINTGIDGNYIAFYCEQILE